MQALILFIARSDEGSIPSGSTAHERVVDAALRSAIIRGRHGFDGGIEGLESKHNNQPATVR